MKEQKLSTMKKQRSSSRICQNKKQVLKPQNLGGGRNVENRSKNLIQNQREEFNPFCDPKLQIPDPDNRQKNRKKVKRNKKSHRKRRRKNKSHRDHSLSS